MSCDNNGQLIPHVCGVCESLCTPVPTPVLTTLCVSLCQSAHSVPTPVLTTLCVSLSICTPVPTPVLTTLCVCSVSLCTPVPISHTATWQPYAFPLCLWYLPILSHFARWPIAKSSALNLAAQLLSCNIFLPILKSQILDCDLLTVKGSRSWEFEIQFSCRCIVRGCMVMGGGFVKLGIGKKKWCVKSKCNPENTYPVHKFTTLPSYNSTGNIISPCLLICIETSSDIRLKYQRVSCQSLLRKCPGALERVW